MDGGREEELGRGGERRGEARRGTGISFSYFFNDLFPMDESFDVHMYMYVILISILIYVCIHKNTAVFV